MSPPRIHPEILLQAIVFAPPVARLSWRNDGPPLAFHRALDGSLPQVFRNGVEKKKGVHVRIDSFPIVSWYPFPKRGARFPCGRSHQRVQLHLFLDLCEKLPCDHAEATFLPCFGVHSMHLPLLTQLLEAEIVSMFPLIRLGQLPRPDR